MEEIRLVVNPYGETIRMMGATECAFDVHVKGDSGIVTVPTSEYDKYLLAVADKIIFEDKVFKKAAEDIQVAKEYGDGDDGVESEIAEWKRHDRPGDYLSYLERYSSRR